MSRWSRATAALVLVTALAGAQEAPRDVLALAREAARKHRYPEVIRLLEPLDKDRNLPAETAFAVAAELGRAHYHLGRYELAYAELRRAVALDPRNAEAGVYLEACAWLTGRREEALEIFEALVASGAQDLYLAVALPGERRFLAEPRVWRIVARHAKTLAVDLRRGRALGVALGMTESEAARAVPAWPGSEGSEVAARAGPYPVWAFRLERGRVERIVVQVENALRYTPYRLRLACGLDWRATPEALERLLGPPVKKEPMAGGDQVLVWRFGDVEARVAFGPPRDPVPPGIAPGSFTLRALELRRPGGR